MASTVIKEATIITVNDKTTLIINPEAKKMADEIEAKMEKEMDKVDGDQSVFTFWFGGFIILGALGVIFECEAFLRNPYPDYYPLALNQGMLQIFEIFTGFLILLGLCFVATQVQCCVDVKRKSKKTKLLVNLIRKANQAERGVLRSAVEELNKEYSRKQEELKLARRMVVILAGWLVMWIGIYAAMVGVVDCFFPLNNVARRTFWDSILAYAVPVVIFFVIFFLLSSYFWCCPCCGDEEEKDEEQLLGIH